MKINDAAPYRVKSISVNWLVITAAVATVVLMYVNLPSRDEMVTVVTEPKETHVDPHFEALIERDLMKIVADFGRWGQPALLEDINAGEQGVSDLRKRYMYSSSSSMSSRYRNSSGL